MIWCNSAQTQDTACCIAGVAMVSDDGKLQWPARDRNGICGDAVGEKKWDVPGQIAQTYSSGQKITTDIVFAQNHLGRVQMRLCQLNAKKESECQDLKRCVVTAGCLCIRTRAGPTTLSAMSLLAHYGWQAITSAACPASVTSSHAAHIG